LKLFNLLGVGENKDSLKLSGVPPHSDGEVGGETLLL
jgi:hypothetical protein